MDDAVLAKSDGTGLLAHMDACLAVFDALKAAVPLLPRVVGRDDAWDLLFAGVYLHDFGKCHVEFQRVLKKSPIIGAASAMKSIRFRLSINSIWPGMRNASLKK